MREKIPNFAAHAVLLSRQDFHKENASFMGKSHFSVDLNSDYVSVSFTREPLMYLQMKGYADRILIRYGLVCSLIDFYPPDDREYAKLLPHDLKIVFHNGELSFIAYSRTEAGIYYNKRHNGQIIESNTAVENIYAMLRTKISDRFRMQL